MLLSLMTVDDELHVHDGLDAIMDWNALNCSHAYRAINGKEALDLALRHRPQIILTDVRMPLMDGLTLIEKIREIPGYDPAIIIMSGYDDFSYVKKALHYRVADYLLKPIDEEELARSLLRIAESRLPGDHEPVRRAALSTVYRRLAQDGSVSAASEFSGLMSHVSPNPPFAFGLLVVLPKAGEIDGNSDLIVRIPQALAGLKNNAVACCVYQENIRSFGLLISGVLLAGETENVELEMKAFCRALRDKLDLQFRLILGIQVATINAIANSRQSVFDYLAENYVMDSPGYLCVDSDKKQRAEDCFGRDVVAGLLAQLTAGTAVVRDMAGKIFLDGDTGEIISSRILKDRFLLLMHTVLATIRDMGGIDPESAGCLRELVLVIEFVAQSELQQALCLFLEESLSCIAELRNWTNHNTILSVVRAVEHRCCEDLSLNDLSQELGINPVYLGQLFKKETGLNFRDFLRQARIREACRLLQSSNSRISEIGRKVGYQSYDYFVSQFRRELALTPSEFRRKKTSEIRNL